MIFAWHRSGKRVAFEALMTRPPPALLARSGVLTATTVDAHATHRADSIAQENSTGTRMCRAPSIEEAGAREAPLRP